MGIIKSTYVSFFLYDRMVSIPLKRTRSRLRCGILTYTHMGSSRVLAPFVSLVQAGGDSEPVEWGVNSGTILYVHFHGFQVASFDNL